MNGYNGADFILSRKSKYNHKRTKGTTEMWTAIVRFLSKTVLGELFARLLKNTASTIFKTLTDKENNRKAYEFVKELNGRTDLTNSEKAKEFNRKMLDWAKSIGRELKESTINCLREFAVNIIKAESESPSK